MHGGRGPAETGRDAMELHHLPLTCIHLQRIPLLFKVRAIKLLVVDRVVSKLKPGEGGMESTYLLSHADYLPLGPPHATGLVWAGRRGPNFDQ